jgi:hypothetical protein
MGTEVRTFPIRDWYDSVPPELYSWSPLLFHGENLAGFPVFHRTIRNAKRMVNPEKIF